MQLTELIAGDVLVGFDKGGPVPGGGSLENRLCGSGSADITVRVMRRTQVKIWLGLRSVEQTNWLSTDFRWLPYVDARVNVTAAGGKDVLSGLFSGCVMSRYKLEGAFQVAHVFCDTDGLPSDCKPFWTEYAKTVTEVIQFKPHEHNDVDRGGNRIFGLITDNGARWAISGRNYNVRLKNTLTEKDWIDKITSDGKFKGTKEEIKAFAKLCAANKTCSFEEMYGISLEICGLKKVT